MKIFRRAHGQHGCLQNTFAPDAVEQKKTRSVGQERVWCVYLQELAKKLDDLVKSAAVVLFMKGSPEAPMCGFSARAVGILNSLDVEEYTFVNILQYPDVRALAKKHFNWPTYPMLIVGGEVIGGVDIMDELNKTGELRATIMKALKDYTAETGKYSD